MALAVAAAWSVVGAGAAWAQPLAVTYRNSVGLPSSAVDQHGQAFTITGLSGLTHVAGARWAAVMDNSNKVVMLDLVLAADGAVVSASVAGAVSLAETMDFEDIAYTGALRYSVLLCEEGGPSVREYRLVDGSLAGVIAAPAVFASRRTNFGFESVSMRSGGGEVWVCNEEALTVDGALSTQAAGTTVRLVRYTSAGAGLLPSVASSQFACAVQPLHGAPTSGSRSGVSALVVLPSGVVLSLERSLAAPFIIPTFQSRIYELAMQGASDIAAPPTDAGLIGQAYTPVGKRLLYSGSHLNMEGLALGPPLPGGGWSLVGIVDDGDPLSTNRVVAFRLTGDAGSLHCAADIDRSGVADPTDIALFISVWLGSLGTGTVAGDFDGNGTVDPADVAGFIYDWLAAVASACS
ncbi:MAG: esterase-like activity of phytase family protein [Phycisphaeraceae bacterium]|nr:esterase-like activity of phytase family protein [Phycisphaeraceae bacterium]